MVASRPAGIALHLLVAAGGDEYAVSGHDRIVFPGFAALGLPLLSYACIRAMRNPSRLPHTTRARPGNEPPPTWNSSASAAPPTRRSAVRALFSTQPERLVGFDSVDEGVRRDRRRASRCQAQGQTGARGRPRESRVRATCSRYRTAR